MQNNDELKGTKFALAYSGGKDSVYAMHKAIEVGMIPVCMIIMVDESNGRSWSHGISPSVLNQVEEAFGIPLIIVKSNNDSYKSNLEGALKQAKDMGVDYCVFGDLFDIPYEENWNTKCCNNAEVKAFYPLMSRDRNELIIEFINDGYESIINTVNASVLSEDFIGKIIDLALIEELKKTDCDICGENGEYHSIVLNGPIFKKPIVVDWGDIIRFTGVTGSYTYKIML